MSKKTITDQKSGRKRALRPYERADGRFERKIQIGKKPNGAPDRITVYGNSRAELDRNVSEIQYKINRNLPIVTKSITVQNYALKWLDIYKTNLSTSTRVSYKNIICNHLYSLEQQELKLVLPIDIQNYFNNFACNTILKTTNKPPSNSLLKYARLVLNQVFKKALRDHIISYNPMDGLEMPKAHDGQIRALTEWEQSLFNKVANNMLESGTEQQSKFALIVLAMLYAGLRRGEAIALDNHTADFGRNMLCIRHSITFNGNRGCYGSPKTKAGIRDIPLTEPLLTPLKEHVDKLKSKYKNHTEEPVFIFSTQQNAMATESSFDRAWSSFLFHVNQLACQEKEIPTPKNKWGNPDMRLKMPVIIDRINPHMLRHTYATMLCESGVDLKTATVWFGHKDVQLLLEIYSDLRRDHEKIEAQKLNQFLNNYTE